MADEWGRNAERITALEVEIRHLKERLDEKIDELAQSTKRAADDLAAANQKTGAKVDEMYSLLMEAKGAKRTLQAAIILVAGGAGFLSGKVGSAIMAFLTAK